MPSVYSSPQPATKTYDHVAEVITHLTTYGTSREHLRELQEEFGYFTVALALDRLNERHD